MMNEHAQLVVIRTFSHPDLARVLQAALDSEGIESHLGGEHTVAVAPYLANAIGGVQLLVRECDAPAAARILKDYSSARAKGDAERDGICPECQCENGRRIRRSVIFSVLAVLTLGLFCFLFHWPRYRCTDCGHEWR